MVEMDTDGSILMTNTSKFKLLGLRRLFVMRKRYILAMNKVGMSIITATCNIMMAVRLVYYFWIVIEVCIIFIISLSPVLWFL